MGFGHRVYKSYDPRATIIKRTADEVFEVTGRNPLLDIAMELERIALRDDYFVSRKLYPNVDFYSGLIYQAMGFPTDMFPVLFAIPRTAGWLAQWEEMLLDPDTKIVRPRQVYTGSDERTYQPSRSGADGCEARGAPLTPGIAIPPEASDPAQTGASRQTNGRIAPGGTRVQSRTASGWRWRSVSRWLPRPASVSARAALCPRQGRSRSRQHAHNGSAVLPFDSGRAFEHVRQLVAIGPRPAGSPGIEAARRYIRDQIAAIGLSATEQAFDAQTPLGPLKMVNLSVVIPAPDPNGC